MGTFEKRPPDYIRRAGLLCRDQGTLVKRNKTLQLHDNRVSTVSWDPRTVMRDPGWKNFLSNHACRAARRKHESG